MATHQVTLKVTGLSQETSRSEFLEYFSKYEPTSPSVFVQDPTGKEPTYGYLRLAESNAKNVLEDNHTIRNKEVHVEEYSSYHVQVPSNSNINVSLGKIFVGGLPPNITNEEFGDYFKTFGKIVNSKVIRDSLSGRPKGFGFVTYAKEESAEDALKNRLQWLNGKVVEVKRAIPRKRVSDDRNWSVYDVHSGLWVCPKLIYSQTCLR